MLAVLAQVQKKLCSGLHDEEIMSSWIMPAQVDRLRFRSYSVGYNSMECGSCRLSSMAILTAIPK